MTSETTEALWSPTEERIASAQLTAFMNSVRDTTGFDAGGDYFALHQWSLDEPAAFWRAVWDFAEIQEIRAGWSVMTLSTTGVSVVPRCHTEFR